MSKSTPKSVCPQCGYVMDATTEMTPGDGTPRAGDISLCLACGQLLTFSESLVLRKLSAAEVGDLMTEGEAWKLIERLQAAIKARKPMLVKSS